MRPFPTDPWHKVVLGGVSLEKWAVTAFRGETTFIQTIEAIFRGVVDNFSPKIQSIFFSWKTTFILGFKAFFRERQLLSRHLGQSHFSGSGLRGHGQTVNVRYKQESFRWNLRKYYWAWVKARIKVSIGRSKKQKDDVSWVGWPTGPERRRHNKLRDSSKYFRHSSEPAPKYSSIRKISTKSPNPRPFLTFPHLIYPFCLWRDLVNQACTSQVYHEWASILVAPIYYI